MNKTKRLEFIMLLIYPILISAVLLSLKANAFLSVVAYLVLPSVYLSWRCKSQILRTLIFSGIASVPSMIIIDYIAQLSGQWLEPQSILNFRLFGVVPLELVLWAFFSTYLMIIFYEYFLDEHLVKNLWLPRMKYLVYILVALWLIFSVFLIVHPRITIPYFYLLFGTLLILIPTIIEFIAKPNLITKFLIAGAYFFVLTASYEVTAVKLNWWQYPSSDFIGWVSVLGVKFPLEEFIFWLMLLALACLSYYEFFYDNQK